MHFANSVKSHTHTQGEGRREGGKEGRREGGKVGRREGGQEGRKEGGKEGRREGGKETIGSEREGMEGDVVPYTLSSNK